MIRCRNFSPFGRKRISTGIISDDIIPYPAVFFHYEFLLINYFPNTSHHPNSFQNLICPPSTIHIRKFLPPKWHLPSVDFFLTALHSFAQIPGLILPNNPRRYPEKHLKQMLTPVHNQKPFHALPSEEPPIIAPPSYYPNPHPRACGWTQNLPAPLSRQQSAYASVCSNVQSSSIER